MFFYPHMLLKQPQNLKVNSPLKNYVVICTVCPTSEVTWIHDSFALQSFLNIYDFGSQESLKTSCAPASILFASIVHALFSQRSCSVFLVYFCTVKCQTCSRLYARSIPPSEYVCWVMNCNVFQVIIYLNSSRCYLNFLLFSLSPLQEPSLHPLLTSTSTDA